MAIMTKLPGMIIVVIATGVGAGVAAASPCDWNGGDHDWGRTSRSYRPASAYEIGFVWERFDVDAMSQPVTAKVVRFDTRAWLGRHMYFGGEAEWGRLSAEADVPINVLARAETNTMTTPITGTLGAAKVVLGTGATAGMFSGGAELATGVRYATFTASPSAPGGSLDTAFVLEGRGRLDLQLTRVITVGAVAGVDLQDRHAVTAGLVVGLRFLR